MSITTWLDKTFYPKFGNNWDNTIFRETALPYLNPKTILLDVGAGRGALPQMNFKENVAVAHGVDPDEVVKTNPYIEKAFVGLADNMPEVASDFYDVIVCNNVFEHVEFPDKFLTETGRVLKSGGIYIAKTPNKNHYIPTLSGILPEGFHKFYNKLRGRPVHDTFPTFYRMNSRAAIRKLAEKNGFEVIEIKLIEGRPEYLRINFIPYIIGIIYERLINALRLDGIKIVMFIVLKKK